MGAAKGIQVWRRVETGGDGGTEKGIWGVEAGALRMECGGLVGMRGSRGIRGVGRGGGGGTEEGIWGVVGDEGVEARGV